MIFDTERLFVREFSTEDLQTMHEYSSDLEVVRFQAWGPNTLEQTKAFLETTIAEQREVPRRSYNLAVCSKVDARLLGGVSILTNELSAEASIGFSFSARAWGKGFATEAARALIKFGFEHLNLKTLNATCDARNISSQRVLEKCGFEEIGLLVSDVVLRDGPRDTMVFKLNAGAVK